MIKLVYLVSRQIYLHVGDAKAVICEVTDMVYRLLGNLYYVRIVVIDK